MISVLFFFSSSRRRHTRWPRDWSSDVCSSDLGTDSPRPAASPPSVRVFARCAPRPGPPTSAEPVGSRTQPVATTAAAARSEEHTSELQSRGHLVCRLLLEKKKKRIRKRCHETGE